MVGFDYGSFSFALSLTPPSLINVYKSRRAYSQRFLPTLAQHVPFVLFVLLSLSWSLSPHSHILSHSFTYGIHKGRAIGGIIEFALLIMFAFGRLNPRIILARLTRSPFPWFNFGAFGPLLLGSAYVNLGFVFQG
jgi:ethanolaminephosphotransferase